MEELQIYRESYAHKTHVYGRIWNFGLSILLLLAPIAACFLFNTNLDWAGFWKGFAATAPTYYAVAAIEIMTYIPMLGSGGSYVSFVTGNISNLKLPVALNALQQAEVDIKTEEGELVSTISICVSSIVTTLIIIVGVILIVPLQPILESEILAPAFNMIVPALFGGLGVVFLSKNIKISIAPVLLMIILFIFVPALNSKLVGLMAPVGVVFTIIVSRILYKKNKL